MHQHPIKYLYVYILQCNDNTFYTGVTHNLELRLMQHNQGININSYTFSRRPVSLVYKELFTDYNLAIQWESKIKKWSHKKKKALIESNWDKLKNEASCKNSTSHKTLLDSARSDTLIEIENENIYN